MEATYYVTRFFEEGGNTRIKHGLTLEEAQAHCKDPETSSSTCSPETAERVARDYATEGRWFDGYDEE